MNSRVLLFVIAIDSALAAVFCVLWLRARDVQPAVAPAPAAEMVARAELDAEKKRASELEQRLSDAEKRGIGEVAALKEDYEKKLAAATEKAPEEVAKPEGEDKDKEKALIEALMAKLGKQLQLEGDIPQEVIDALGLGPAQVDALKLALEDETKRIDEAMQKFYAENVDAKLAGLEEKPAKELFLKMMKQFGEDLKKLGEMPLEKQLSIHSTSSIEELLGEEAFTSKVAREVHKLRLQTYRNLEHSMTADQIAKLRAEYLAEGSIYYDDVMHFEFGAAPADLKK